MPNDNIISFSEILKKNKLKSDSDNIDDVQENVKDDKERLKEKYTEVNNEIKKEFQEIFIYIESLFDSLQDKYPVINEFSINTNMLSIYQSFINDCVMPYVDYNEDFRTLYGEAYLENRKKIYESLLTAITKKKNTNKKGK